MPALQADDIADLVIAADRNRGRMKWTDIASTLQEYVALPQLLDKNKVGFDSGRGMQWQVMVTLSNAAQNVGMYGVDSVNVSDVLKTCSLQWRHTTTNYAFERREIAMNREPERILELLKPREYDAMVSLAEKMENNFWSLPASDSTVDPHGVPYWVVKNAIEGFNGGHPSGYSDVAGLSRTTYPGWRNYTAPYSDISKADLIRKWRRASVFTKFKPYTQYPSYANGKSKYGYYTNYSVLGRLEEMLESQNDNLGNDVASMDGEVTFRRTSVMWVPKLENDTDNPIYGLNWAWFRPVFLKGEYMKKTGPMLAPNQHTVYHTFIDITYNFECRNCREQFVLSNGTSGTV